MTTKTTTKPTEPMPSRTDLLQQELAQHQAEADRRRGAPGPQQTPPRGGAPPPPPPLRGGAPRQAGASSV
jgi:hypothetical protein